MKLSKAQIEILDAMKRGTVIHYMSGVYAYYFRNDTMKNCTKTAIVLENLGLVEKFNVFAGRYSLRLKK